MDLRKRYWDGFASLPRSISRLAPTAVVWDLDSVLAKTEHRHWMVPEIKAGRLTWEDYALAAADDIPDPAAVDLLRLLSLSHLQAVVTNRSAAARELTQRWFERHEIPARRLIMRPAAEAKTNVSERDAYEWKARQILELESAGVAVLLAFEDWPDAAAVIRELTGVPVMVVNPCYPEDPDSSRPSLTNVAGL